MKKKKKEWNYVREYYEPELRKRPGMGTEVYRLDYFDKKKNVAIYEFVGVER